MSISSLLLFFLDNQRRWNARDGWWGRNATTAENALVLAVVVAVAPCPNRTLLKRSLAMPFLKQMKRLE
jgi:hypothetical protein